MPSRQHFSVKCISVLVLVRTVALARSLYPAEAAVPQGVVSGLA